MVTDAFMPISKVFSFVFTFGFNLSFLLFTICVHLFDNFLYMTSLPTKAGDFF